MTQLQIYKSLDDMLGTQTRGGMMEGADESIELWRHLCTYVTSISIYYVPMNLVLLRTYVTSTTM